MISQTTPCCESQHGEWGQPENALQNGTSDQKKRCRHTSIAAFWISGGFQHQKKKATTTGSQKGQFAHKIQATPNATCSKEFKGNLDILHD